MITITIYKSNDQYTGFDCLGHAGFANSGKDIICSAVSVLVINTIHSIDVLTKQQTSVKTEEKSGFIQYSLSGQTLTEAKLLLDSMILGLHEIEKQYGNKYLKIKFKEV
ncbi:MAG TPA: ribosomal-processing cysteine protease Prp [Lachnospiraceae bacterium]|nr:ribosomal-processing cysteine protease Prp [Lachnospiraceae bacterium]